VQVTHRQGQKLDYNTPNPTAGCCVSWALEAWLCPAPPLRGQQMMPRSLQDCYRKAHEDTKERADMSPTVLATASHCSGPPRVLTSVDLFPSFHSGM